MIYRRPPSSMRAATRTQRERSITRSALPESQFATRIQPDSKTIERRREYRAAIASLAQKFEELRQSAEYLQERDIWQTALDRLLIFTTSTAAKK